MELAPRHGARIGADAAPSATAAAKKKGAKVSWRPEGH
jgi:hypothetical protein